MTHNKIQKFLVLVTLSAGVFAAGCELIVDFDRTKIPVEVTEASVADSSPGSDSAPASDGATDAAVEADATPEASPPSDAASDADADQ
jgi:hypothetical protein